MAGEITGLIAGAAMDAAQAKKALADAKKGKSKEQKDIIDFFASEYGGSGCGCLGKGSRSMSMDEYQRKILLKLHNSIRNTTQDKYELVF